MESRLVRVPPERLAGWLAGFQERHGPAVFSADGAMVGLVAPDGAEAEIEVPFPPIGPASNLPAELLEHVSQERRVGALLVRKGGYAVGVFSGHRLIASKVGSAYVQSRTKAGGWSQQRFARRRDNQASKAFEAAADAAARILLPTLDQLVTVVLGGDRTAVIATLADPRLAPVRDKGASTLLAVPDPRLRVLEALPEQFLAVRIHLNALA